jgi:hypothetical protein
VFEAIGSGTAALAAAATLRAILGSPDFVRHTAVPYAVLVLAAAAALVGAVHPQWRRS